MNLQDKPKTIIIDIDGTILYHHGTQHAQLISKPLILDGVYDKFHEWESKGYHIILITGRKESTRQVTENQLRHSGLYYDQLIMGVTSGIRILINDLKLNSDQNTAQAINIKKNLGIKDIQI